MGTIEAIATVVVAFLGVVGTIWTTIIEKRSNKVIDKIDRQTKFINKEKSLKQKLNQLDSGRQSIVYEMSIITMETNLIILKHMKLLNDKIPIDESMFETSRQLKDRYDDLTSEIEETTRQYDLVLDMLSEIDDTR